MSAESKDLRAAGTGSRVRQILPWLAAAALLYALALAVRVLRWRMLLHSFDRTSARDAVERLSVQQRAAVLIT